MKNIPDALKKLLQKQAKSINNHIHNQAIPMEDAHKYPSNIIKMVKTRELNKKNKLKVSGLIDSSEIDTSSLSDNFDAQVNLLGEDPNHSQCDFKNDTGDAL